MTFNKSSLVVEPSFGRRFCVVFGEISGIAFAMTDSSTRVFSLFEGIFGVDHLFAPLFLNHFRCSLSSLRRGSWIFSIEVENATADNRMVFSLR